MTDTKVLAYENSRFLVESTALDKAMTLHEFMHLAGLHHDDMRGVWGDAFYGPLRMQRLTEIDMFSITSYRWIHVGIAQNGGYLRFYDSTADLYSRGDKNVGLIMDQKEKSAQSILDELKQDPPTDRIVESDPSMYRLMQTKVGLSEGDIFSLRCLHKIKQKDILKKCDNATPWL